MANASTANGDVSILHIVCVIKAEIAKGSVTLSECFNISLVHWFRQWILSLTAAGGFMLALKTSWGGVQVKYSKCVSTPVQQLVNEDHQIATGNHILYGITQCYLLLAEVTPSRLYPS